MKRFAWLGIAVTVLTTLLSYAGCEDASALIQDASQGRLASNSNFLPGNSPNNLPTSVGGNTGGFPAMPPSVSGNASRGKSTITIASFNIQAFGPSKMDQPWVMQRLAAVLLNFDVIALQEIRSKDQNLMNVLLSYVNQGGAKYNYLLGERLGRTVSKEQYAYVYNTQTIYTQADQTYTVADPQDLLHREPLVARFVVLGDNTFRPFSFTLANVHTDPDEVEQEVSVLGAVYQSIVGYEAATVNEDDVIMLGDFNADARTLAAHARQNEFTPIITTQPTNVLRNKQYDNFVINPYACREYSGNSGVLDLQNYFQIDENQAKTLSDHNPIWAEFSIAEIAPQSGGRTADAGANNVR